MFERLVSSWSRPAVPRATQPAAAFSAARGGRVRRLRQVALTTKVAAARVAPLGTAAVWCGLLAAAAGADPAPVDSSRSRAADGRPVYRTPPIVVRAARAADAATQPGRYTLEPERLARQIASFEDVVRGVHALPGVGTASDLHGDFSVRGSGAHANSIWIDGIEVFFPYHLLGFNSVFNPGLVESAEFWSGGVPAEFGDATGGVLAVRSRGLLPARERGAVGLSYLSAQGRAAAGGATWGGAASLRRSYHDKLIDLLGGAGGHEIPAFHDVFLRGHWQPSPRFTLAAGVLHAGDGLTLLSPELRASDFNFIAADAESRERAFRDFASVHDRLTIHNRMTLVSLYARGVIGARTYVETTLGWVPQRFELGLRGDNDERVDIRAQVASLRQDVTLRRSNHRLRAGWLAYRDDTVRRVSAWIGILDLRESNASLNLHDIQERYEIDAARRRDYQAVYAQDEWTPWQRLTLGGGLRVEHDGLGREVLWSPRLSLEQRLGKASTLRATWNRVHGLRDKPMEVLPTATGAPAGAERSHETTLGLTTAPGRGVTAGASAWLKHGSRLVYASAPAVFANGGVSQGRGAELWVRLEPRDAPVHGGISLAWSRTRQRDPLAWRRRPDYTARDLDGFWRAEFEAPYWYRPVEDQPLRLGLDAQARWRAWDLGLRLQLASGRPYTPVEAVAVDPLNTRYGIAGAKGSARYPLYRRLDVRVQRRFEGAGLRWNVYADILNVTAADNVYQVRYNPAYTSRYVVHMLPTLPTLGVEARF
jgi:hypothetical protein